MAHKHHTSEAGKNLIISIILNLFIVVFELMVKIKNLLRNNFKINYSAIQMLSEKEAKKNRSWLRALQLISKCSKINMKDTIIKVAKPLWRQIWLSFIAKD